MDIQQKEYIIQRYDLSDDNSLRPWSAADEYLLRSFSDLEKKPNHLGIYNDRFGFLGCQLHSFNPTIVLTHKSQEKAINSNLKANSIDPPNFTDPLASLENKMYFALVKIPKSLGLFQLFLEQITQNSTDDITVTCAFMTRHFSPKMLEVAQEYFEVIEQSKALKKARLLILTKKKKTVKRETITTLDYKGQAYKQYLGVFSADHIDYATQFFLDHLEIEKTDQKVLDLASGNGIIGNEIVKQFPQAEVHLVDDSFLAVSSAELNVKGKNIHHHFNDDVSIFDNDTFDLIVTNPPFHFEYEINIKIPLELFRGCFKCLKVGGNLQVVASQHLNYLIHLERLFPSVQVIAEDKKFVIYKCTK